MPRLHTTGWDVVEHLRTEEDMALYLEAALEDGDPELVAAALGDIARASGKGEIVAGLGLELGGPAGARQAPGDSDLAAVLKAIKELGLRLRVSAEH